MRLLIRHKACCIVIVLSYQYTTRLICATSISNQILVIIHIKAKIFNSYAHCNEIYTQLDAEHFDIDCRSNIFAWYYERQNESRKKK